MAKATPVGVKGAEIMGHWGGVIVDRLCCGTPCRKRRFPCVTRPRVPVGLRITPDPALEWMAMTELEERTLKFYLRRVGRIAADEDFEERNGTGRVMPTPIRRRFTRRLLTGRRPLPRDICKLGRTSVCRCPVFQRRLKERAPEHPLLATSHSHGSFAALRSAIRFPLISYPIR